MTITVNDRTMEWFEGMTVSDVLERIEDDFPYAVVRINETHISRPNFETTFVPDQAEVYLIPMVSGG